MSDQCSVIDSDFLLELLILNVKRANKAADLIIRSKKLRTLHHIDELHLRYQCVKLLSLKQSLKRKRFQSTYGDLRFKFPTCRTEMYYDS